ncbi:unnamed protein product [Toxocara canis]|uniref:Transmembrane protein n=1 Tax=Toxocara canis TaxID=6265 RepID=A0A183VBJ8_TOXCA|nr:unnamed protein product [Toxocara canis]
MKIQNVECIVTGHIASSIAPFLGYLIVLVVYVWFYAMVSLCTDVSADHIRIAGNFVSKDDQIAPLCSAWKDIAVAYLIFWAPFWLIHHISLFVYLPWPWKVFYSVAKLFSNFTSFVQAMLAIRALSSLSHYSASGLEVGDQERDYPENSALMALASQANAISTWVKTDAMSGGRRTHRSSDDGEFSSSEDQRRKVLASRQLDAIIFGDSFTEEE